ncbi:MAG: hypothetical protein HN348_15680, partial [Proteobacteria bacterium]|nr:hypothetical protein [Pseudomonadota bacterium]
MGPIAAEDDDCNDGSDIIYPGAAEAPDRDDNDCDGDRDEETKWFDDDEDDYCEGPEDCTVQLNGSQAQPGDCNDSNVEVPLDGGGFMNTDQ